MSTLSSIYTKVRGDIDAFATILFQHLDRIETPFATIPSDLLVIQFYIDGEYRGVVDSVAFRRILKVDGLSIGAKNNYKRKLEIESRARDGCFFFPKSWDETCGNDQRSASWGI